MDQNYFWMAERNAHRTHTNTHTNLHRSTANIRKWRKSLHFCISRSGILHHHFHSLNSRQQRFWVAWFEARFPFNSNYILPLCFPQYRSLVPHLSILKTVLRTVSRFVHSSPFSFYMILLWWLLCVCVPITSIVPMILVLC